MLLEVLSTKRFDFGNRKFEVLKAPQKIVEEYFKKDFIIIADSQMMKNLLF